eukprot:13796191-Alexandrium_andersonii.AAC.1
MSASLVGSEMCIRDSALSLIRRLSDSLGVPTYAPGSYVSNYSYCVKPVSYTHLTLPTICSV